MLVKYMVSSYYPKSVLLKMRQQRSRRWENDYQIVAGPKFTAVANFIGQAR